MKLSHKGRPICMDENCTVEIAPTQKYCDAHNYLLNKWLKKSREQLASYRGMELEKAA